MDQLEKQTLPEDLHELAERIEYLSEQFHLSNNKHTRTALKIYYLEAAQVYNKRVGKKIFNLQP